MHSAQIMMQSLSQERQLWGDDIENILENLRVNSVVLSKEHKRNYFALKSRLKYFKIPIIILSGCNSVLAVGLSSFTTQQIVSVITCIVSLVCGLISSIELYLSIQKSMEDELVYSKEFYLLSVDIYKILNLDRENRPTDAKLYLEDKYNEYTTLVERSQLLAKKISDKLVPMQCIPQAIHTSKTMLSLQDLYSSGSSEEKSSETGESKV